MKFTVDLDELDAVTGSLTTFTDTFAAQLATLESAIASLQGAWSGEAASAQGEAHRRIAAGAKDLHEGLAGMQAAARKAHGSYSGAVQANVSTWAQLR